jgi:hypothetical protein
MKEIMKSFKLLFCFLLLSASALSVNAQTDSFENLLRANTFQIQIQDGKLSGKGAEVIAASLDNVQFVALGKGRCLGNCIFIAD